MRIRLQPAQNKLDLLSSSVFGSPLSGFFFLLSLEKMQASMKMASVSALIDSWNNKRKVNHRMQT